MSETATQEKFEKRLQQIRKRCEAASAGPWFDWEGSIYSGKPKEKRPGMLRGYDTQIAIMEDDELFEIGSKRECSANRRFVAHSREDIPFLLDYVETLRSEIERLRKLVALNDQRELAGE